jgi:hypothetical protein
MVSVALEVALGSSPSRLPRSPPGQAWPLSLTRWISTSRPGGQI